MSSKFDLYVQGFSFVAATDAQYVIHGSDSGNVVGTVTDNVAQGALLPQLQRREPAAPGAFLRE